MKSIEVVAAIIRKDNKVLSTQRGYGEFQGLWEFPGGKIELGEAHKDALKREIREELSVDIEVGDFLHTIEYDYSNFHLTMHCYWCSLDQKIELTEHLSSRWLDKDELYEVEWLDADISLIPLIHDELKRETDN